jgi:hypothetical protein
MSNLRSYIYWYASAAVLTAACLLPILWPGQFSRSLIASEPAIFLTRLVLLLLPLVVSFLALRTASVKPAERVVAWLFCVGCAAFSEVLHYWIVDKGHYFSPSLFADNTVWQEAMHRGIIWLRPDYRPHSYRFLPDCIVEIFRTFSGNFEFARISYRLLFNSLLFAGIFRYAKLYVSSVGSIAIMLIVLLFYPMTIIKYAGQLVDPLSHLSFVVCFYCLVAGNEPGFGVSLFVGILAKESVIVMAICRAFYGRNRVRAFLAACAYFIIGIGVAMGIRLFVNKGEMGYGSISGVDLSHVLVNLAKFSEWGPLYLLTLGTLIPGAVLGWKLMSEAFKATCIVVVSSVLVSSLYFSWLAEVRNLVPAFLPLAVINMKYIETRLRGGFLNPTETESLANKV